MLAIARAGARAGCKEALFTLGDKPELRYAGGARARWRRWATTTTIAYLAAMCELVLRETGLLPHVNPGVMTREEIAALRARVGVAGHHAGEHLASACCEKGGAHYGSPDKDPAVRLETIRDGGRAARCRSPPAS